MFNNLVDIDTWILTPKMLSGPTRELQQGDLRMVLSTFNTKEQETRGIYLSNICENPDLAQRARVLVCLRVG